MLQEVINFLENSSSARGVEFSSEDKTRYLDRLKFLSVEKFPTLDAKTISSVLLDLEKEVPDKVDLGENNISFKRFEYIAEKNGLDLRPKSINARKPPGNRTFRDPQKSFFEVSLIATIALKFIFFQRAARYIDESEFLAEFPELSKSYVIPPDTTDVRRKELIKISQYANIEVERLRCNVVDIIRLLHGKDRKAFKTCSIYLAAAVAGDGCGFLGRDPSANTLRLILYFERLTGIHKRPSRNSLSGDIDMLSSQLEKADHHQQQQQGRAPAGGPYGIGSVSHDFEDDDISFFNSYSPDSVRAIHSGDHQHDHAHSHAHGDHGDDGSPGGGHCIGGDCDCDNCRETLDLIVSSLGCDGVGDETCECDVCFGGIKRKRESLGIAQVKSIEQTFGSSARQGCGNNCNGGGSGEGQQQQEMLSYVGAFGYSGAAPGMRNIAPGDDCGCCCSYMEKTFLGPPSTSCSGAGGGQSMISNNTLDHQHPQDHHQHQQHPSLSRNPSSGGFPYAYHSQQLMANNNPYGGVFGPPTHPHQQIFVGGNDPRLLFNPHHGSFVMQGGGRGAGTPLAAAAGDNCGCCCDNLVNVSLQQQGGGSHPQGPPGVTMMPVLMMPPPNNGGGSSSSQTPRDGASSGTTDDPFGSFGSTIASFFHAAGSNVLSWPGQIVFPGTAYTASAASDGSQKQQQQPTTPGSYHFPPQQTATAPGSVYIKENCACNGCASLTGCGSDGLQTIDDHSHDHSHRAEQPQPAHHYSSSSSSSSSSPSHSHEHTHGHAESKGESGVIKLVDGILIKEGCACDGCHDHSGCSGIKQEPPPSLSLLTAAAAAASADVVSNSTSGSPRSVASSERGVSAITTGTSHVYIKEGCACDGCHDHTGCSSGPPINTFQQQASFPVYIKEGCACDGCHDHTGCSSGPPTITFQQQASFPVYIKEGCACDGCHDHSGCSGPKPDDYMKANHSLQELTDPEAYLAAMSPFSTFSEFSDYDATQRSNEEELYGCCPPSSSTDNHGGPAAATAEHVKYENGGGGVVTAEGSPAADEKCGCCCDNIGKVSLQGHSSGLLPQPPHFAVPGSGGGGMHSTAQGAGNGGVTLMPVLVMPNGGQPNPDGSAPFGSLQFIPVQNGMLNFPAGYMPMHHNGGPLMMVQSAALPSGTSQGSYVTFQHPHSQSSSSSSTGGGGFMMGGGGGGGGQQQLLQSFAVGGEYSSAAQQKYYGYATADESSSGGSSSSSNPVPQQAQTDSSSSSFVEIKP